MENDLSYSSKKCFARSDFESQKIHLTKKIVLNLTKNVEIAKLEQTNSYKRMWHPPPPAPNQAKNSYSHVFPILCARVCARATLA